MSIKVCENGQSEWCSGLYAPQLPLSVYCKLRFTGSVGTGHDSSATAATSSSEEDRYVAWRGCFMPLTLPCGCSQRKVAVLLGTWHMTKIIHQVQLMNNGKKSIILLKTYNKNRCLKRFDYLSEHSDRLFRLSVITKSLYSIPISHNPPLKINRASILVNILVNKHISRLESWNSNEMMGATCSLSEL